MLDLFPPDHQSGNQSTSSTEDLRSAQVSMPEEAQKTASLPVRLVRPKYPSTYQAEPATLLTWLSRLSTRTTDEHTVVGQMGLWPIELAPFIIGLCRCYSNWEDGPPPELTFAASLLSWDLQRQKPIKPRTCLLLFPGDNGSLAAGIQAQRAGYTVIAATVTSINNGYSCEPKRAQQIAQCMGWEHRVIDLGPLAQTPAKSIITNQLAVAAALHILEFVPEIWGAGNCRTDDCHTREQYSDMEVAFATFQHALTDMQVPLATDTTASRHDDYGFLSASREPSYWRQGFLHTWDGYPKRLHPVMDPSESMRIWLEAPREVRALTTSCMMTHARKRTLHEHYASLGVPLSLYECGSCSQCLLKAALLVTQFSWPVLIANYVASVPEHERDRSRNDAASQLSSVEQSISGATQIDRVPYPQTYSDHACRKIAKSFSEAPACHAHPSLESPTFPRGQSRTYLWNTTFGGKLALFGHPPRSQEAYSAREPVISYLTS